LAGIIGEPLGNGKFELPLPDNKMKKAILFFFVSGIVACTQAPDNTQNLERRIDSLEKKLNNSYKPGLGEFMSCIQVHHAKLWFAGKEGNWKLADFEINEIKEAVDDIQKYEQDRTETQQIPMLLPAIETVNNAIKERDETKFRSSFSLLTTTCNNCHHNTAHEFNVITIPETPPFSNQIFKNETPSK